MTMSNDERAIQTARQLRDLLQNFTKTADPANPFDTVGPSDEFLNTHLLPNAVSEADVDNVIAKIDEAIHNSDLATVQTILGAVTGVLGPLKGLFGIL